MDDTEFNKFVESCKERTKQLNEEAEHKSGVGFSLIEYSNAPQVYHKMNALIVKELKKNDDVINNLYTKEQIDIIKMYGKKIYDTGGMEMMLICFDVISYLVGEKNRRAYQISLSIHLDGVGEWQY